MEYQKIKQLIDDMGNSKLTNIDIEFADGTKISMKKDSIQQVPAQVNHVIEINEEPQIIKEEGKIIKSPMVGTFYIKPSPTAQAFVEVGKNIKVGDTLCIIEAMKLMNEIQSDFDCEIEAVLVSNEQKVEYGQPLFRVKKL